MRIIFFGTPDFAVYQAEYLRSVGIEIAAVVTAPDKPAGRGYQLKSSPLKDWAKKCQIAILQPEKLRNPEFLTSLSEFQAECFVVVAFRMLPKVVWQMPPLGTINLHASLLPALRGAAPIHWAIVHGLSKTGVTTFFINETIDTGAILLQESTHISKDETAASLYQKLMELGAPLLHKTLLGIEAKSLVPSPQKSTSETHLLSAPKLQKSMGHISQVSNLESIRNLIRGFDPFPSAFVKLDFQGKTKTLKLFKPQDIEAFEGGDHKVGILIEKEKVFLYSENKRLSILEIQLEGKKRMKSIDFCRGHQGTNDLSLLP